MKSLKSGLELMQSLRVELGQLQTEVTEMGTLKAQVEALSDELQVLRMQASSTTAPAREYYHSDVPEEPASLIPVRRKETMWVDFSELSSMHRTLPTTNLFLVILGI